MNSLAQYDTGNVLGTVASELSQSIELALKRGIYPWQIITDPGFGFAKASEHNLEILRTLPRWQKTVGPFPFLVGTSRKGFIGAITQQHTPAMRDIGTAATVVAAISAGAAFVRIHNTEAMLDAIAVADAIYKSSE